MRTTSRIINEHVHVDSFNDTVEPFNDRQICAWRSVYTRGTNERIGFFQLLGSTIELRKSSKAICSMVKKSNISIL